MLTLGRDRVELIAHRQRLKGQQSLSKWGEHLSALGVEQLVPHLRAIRRRIAAGKAGPSFALLSPLTHLPPSKWRPQLPGLWSTASAATRCIMWRPMSRTSYGPRQCWTVPRSVSWAGTSRPVAVAHTSKR